MNKHFQNAVLGAMKRRSGGITCYDCDYFYRETDRHGHTKRYICKYKGSSVDAQSSGCSHFIKSLSV